MSGVVGRRRIVTEDNSAPANGAVQQGQPKSDVDEPKETSTTVAAVAGESVTFTWGRELYSFQQFTNVEVGPYSATSNVREGESRLQAYDRLAREVTAFAEASRKAKLDSYKRALKGEV